jgi:hypothetical protein
MKNITVCVTERAYREARVWAAARETSISRVVQYLITTLPNISRVANAFPPSEPAQKQPETAPAAALSTEKTAI